MKYVFTITFLLCLIGFSSAWCDEPLLQTNFDNQTAQLWSPGIAVSNKDGTTCLNFKQEFPKTSLTKYVLDLKKISGKKIKVSAKIMIEAITQPKENWFGPKMQICFTDRDGKKHYIATQIPAKTSEWKGYEIVADIPADCSEVILNLGLQGVAGNISFTSLKITEVR